MVVRPVVRPRIAVLSLGRARNMWGRDDDGVMARSCASTRLENFLKRTPRKGLPHKSTLIRNIENVTEDVCSVYHDGGLHKVVG